MAPDSFTPKSLTDSYNIMACPLILLLSFEHQTLNLFVSHGKIRFSADDDTLTVKQLHCPFKDKTIKSCWYSCDSEVTVPQRQWEADHVWWCSMSLMPSFSCVYCLSYKSYIKQECACYQWHLSILSVFLFPKLKPSWPHAVLSDR